MPAAGTDGNDKTILTLNYKLKYTIIFTFKKYHTNMIEIT